MYVDKWSEPATYLPGVAAALAYAGERDVTVVHVLDQLGRTVRDALNLIYDLADRGMWVCNPVDAIKVNSAIPNNPLTQLAVVLLVLFGQMKRAYTLERAARSRALTTAKGRRVGRPSVVSPDKLAYAAHLGEGEHAMTEAVTKTCIARTSFYRHLPPRPLERATAGAVNGTAAPIGQVKVTPISAAVPGGATVDAGVMGPVPEAVLLTLEVRPLPQAAPVVATSIGSLRIRRREVDA